MENKVNMVLNKLSESNIDNIVEEFIYTIKMSNKNEYDYVYVQIESYILDCITHIIFSHYLS